MIVHQVRTLKLLVVEDFEPFRQIIRSTLGDRAEFQVVEAPDGLDALQKIEQLQPDFILLDLDLPNLNGIEVCKCACKLAPAAKILFLTLEFSPDLVHEALNLGAHGYVYKLRAHKDLLPGIDAVLHGKCFVSSGLSSIASVQGRESRQLVAELAGPAYPWQRTVADAIKSRPKSLPRKLNIAERAIAERLMDPDQPSTEELQALKRALRSLAILIAETGPVPAFGEQEKSA